MYDEYGFPAATDRGPICGSCRFHHATVDAIKRCYHLTREGEEQVAADAAAELAGERHLENRGYWEAQAQDDYEALCGVIQFDVAYRLACPELFADELV